MDRPHAGQRPPETAPDSPAARLLRRRRANARSGATTLGVWLARRRGLRLRPGPHGLLVALHHPRAFPLARAGAMCVGDVVLVRVAPGVDDLDGLLRRRPRLLEHEAHHAEQWARWGGPPGFVPAYLAACAWSWWRTGDPHSRNGFEVAAGLDAGGYRLGADRQRLRAAARAGVRAVAALSRGSRRRARA